MSLILRLLAAVVGVLTGAGALYAYTAGGGGGPLLVVLALASFYYASGRFGSDSGEKTA